MIGAGIPAATQVNDGCWASSKSPTPHLHVCLKSSCLLLMVGNSYGSSDNLRLLGWNIPHAQLHATHAFTIHFLHSMDTNKNIIPIQVLTINSLVFHLFLSLLCGPIIYLTRNAMHSCKFNAYYNNSADHHIRFQAYMWSMYSLLL